MIFYLYYLADQLGPITGDKTLQGSFSDLASAQAKASADGIAHYSVEKDVGDGSNITIVFII